ncbi:Hypothetical_protein [Hexamita inflata]|uniref:Hypothetical_protein n=1 Tax=Hexamita inflata TaxID=28002 RepID=A0AA86RIP7_9EUKA|nr:Hypothetical protein HINF_LOCUS60712 [Hexamita inflata]
MKWNDLSNDIIFSTVIAISNCDNSENMNAIFHSDSINNNLIQQLSKVSNHQNQTEIKIDIFNKKLQEVSFYMMKSMKTYLFPCFAPITIVFQLFLRNSRIRNQ